MVAAGSPLVNGPMPKQSPYRSRRASRCRKKFAASLLPRTRRHASFCRNRSRRQRFPDGRLLSRSPIMTGPTESLRRRASRPREVTSCLNSGTRRRPDRAVAADEPAGYQRLGWPAGARGCRSSPLPELRERSGPDHRERDHSAADAGAPRSPAARRPTPTVATPPAPIACSAERYRAVLRDHRAQAAQHGARLYRRAARPRHAAGDDHRVGAVGDGAPSRPALGKRSLHASSTSPSGCRACSNCCASMARPSRATQAGGEPSPRILLASIPGEQHTFGLSVVEEYFRRAGWLVEVEIGGDAARPGRAARHRMVRRDRPVGQR